MSVLALKMNNRDDYTRCKICKELFKHEQCVLDPVKGYLCPRGCEPPYNQEPYEPPIDDE